MLLICDPTLTSMLSTQHGMHAYAMRCMHMLRHACICYLLMAHWDREAEWNSLPLSSLGSGEGQVGGAEALHPVLSTELLQSTPPPYCGCGAFWLLAHVRRVRGWIRGWHSPLAQVWICARSGVWELGGDGWSGGGGGERGFLVRPFGLCRCRLLLRIELCTLDDPPWLIAFVRLAKWYRLHTDRI